MTPPLEAPAPGWRSFAPSSRPVGRPSDVAIDKNEVIYVTDDQSNQNNNPGFRTGIRIGSAKDGKVTSFIPTPNADIATLKEWASTMPAMSTAAGSARWRSGAGPRADPSDNSACFHPPRSGRVISYEAPPCRAGTSITRRRGLSGSRPSRLRENDAGWASGVDDLTSRRQLAGLLINPEGHDVVAVEVCGVKQATRGVEG